MDARGQPKADQRRIAMIIDQRSAVRCLELNGCLVSIRCECAQRSAVALFVERVDVAGRLCSGSTCMHATCAHTAAAPLRTTKVFLGLRARQVLRRLQKAVQSGGRLGLVAAVALSRQDHLTRCLGATALPHNKVQHVCVTATSHAPCARVTPWNV